MFPEPTMAAVSFAMEDSLANQPSDRQNLVPQSGPQIGVSMAQVGHNGAMPLMQIDLMEGHGPDVHRQLLERCTALYAEVVATPIERFRCTINVVPASQWSLGGEIGPERISPLINLRLMEGRSMEMLHRLMREMATLVAEILQIPIGNTRVVIAEIPVTHWGIGGVPVSEGRPT
jgi:4-oxalocrotonate tautomerase